MNITTKFRMILAAITVITLAACEGVPIKLGSAAGSVVSSANAVPVEAKSCGFQLLWFIPININTRHEHAWRALQARAHGGTLTDVKVKDEWFWGGVGTVYCTTLLANANDGMIASVPRGGPALPPAPAAAAAPEPVAVVAAAPAPVVAAPVPQPVAVAPPAAAAPAPTAALVAPAQAAGQASTRDGASLRDKPALISAGGKVIAIMPAGTTLVLKQKISNRSGVWWFVGTETRGDGWIREQELDQVKH